MSYTSGKTTIKRRRRRISNCFCLFVCCYFVVLFVSIPFSRFSGGKETKVWLFGDFAPQLSFLDFACARKNSSGQEQHYDLATEKPSASMRYVDLC